MLTLFKSTNWDQKKFIGICLAFSFLLTADYACLRPIVQSLFVTHFGSKMLPLVWLLSLPINFLVVAAFNRFQAKLGSRIWVMIFPVFVILSNLFLAYASQAHSGFIFGLYLWKDLYILLMFQQLWSQIQASFGKNPPKVFYGWMYAIGAVGSFFGSSLPAQISLKPELFLYSSLLFYPLILLVQHRLLQNPLHAPFEKTQTPQPLNGLRLIKKSMPLITIALFVAFMQMSSALAEFVFSRHLEKDFLDVSSRMKAMGKVTGIMHGCTLLLQVGLSLFVLSRWNEKKGHTLIPGTLMGVSGLYLAMPSFLTASLGYISCKALDFSLFSVLKETLYAPLDKESKYEAKSFIDIFVYRGSKAIMSLILLGFSMLQTPWVFGFMMLALAAIWFWVTRKRLALSFETS